MRTFGENPLTDADSKLRESHTSWARARACARVCAGNVTVVIRTVDDEDVQIYPPLGNNRTIVVELEEERPVGSFVYRPLVRDVDNPAATFRYQLTNISIDGYLAIDPNTGTRGLRSGF